MLSVAVPIVRGEGARNLIPIRQLAPGAKPPAGQLLLAIWNVTPLVVPVTLAVIGPVEPDPAGPTLVRVTFCTALKPDPTVKKVRVAGDLDSLVPEPVKLTTRSAAASGLVSFEFTIIVPVNDPDAVGWNVR
jgi:hypothetical protein